MLRPRRNYYRRWILAALLGLPSRNRGLATPAKVCWFFGVGCCIYSTVITRTLVGSVSGVPGRNRIGEERGYAAALFVIQGPFFVSGASGTFLFSVLCSTGRPWRGLERV